MQLVPLGDKVIIVRTEAEQQTSGGILLPDAAKTKTNTGRVLSVGRGRMVDSGAIVSPQVQEGDRVLFQDWAGSEITLDGETLVILAESDILAVMG